MSRLRITDQLIGRVHKLMGEYGLATFSGRSSGFTRTELRLLERRGIIYKSMVRMGQTIYYLYGFRAEAR